MPARISHSKRWKKKHIHVVSSQDKYFHDLTWLLAHHTLGEFYFIILTSLFVRDASESFSNFRNYAHTYAENNATIKFNEN